MQQGSGFEPRVTDMSEYHVESWKRLNKRDGVTGERAPGSWHAMHSGGAQAWCGSKVKGFLAEYMRAGEQPPGAICTACTSAVIKDQPKPYRRT